MSPGPFRDPFGPPSGRRQLSVDALARAVSRNDVAAIVVEPIQLEGGVRPLSSDFIAALAELTEKHGTLLVADEIQTGLGRTGSFLASERWPRRPDCVIVGKHLGGGLLPISAMLTRQELFDQAYGASFESAESHNSTFGGNAMACVAAEAALDLLSDELLLRVREVGRSFRGSLSESLARFPLFREIRGDGLIVGIRLEPTDHPGSRSSTSG